MGYFTKISLSYCAAAAMLASYKEPIAVDGSYPCGTATILRSGRKTAEVAVISLGGIVSSGSVRVGGTKFDQSIAEYIRHKYNLAIGEGPLKKLK